MIHKSIRYAPYFLVELFEYEVQELEDCARKHYDPRCIALAQPGGTVFGFLNRLSIIDKNEPHRIEVELSREDVDLFCKVLERSRTNLYDRFMELLKIQDLHQPVNRL